ncbi:hypothetical protein FRC11_008265 [Ceratobasidium sp. 423]|nr:hypothetical protein FRC11_008265 [Ceratobasidium sp. 423]
MLDDLKDSDKDGECDSEEVGSALKPPGLQGFGNIYYFPTPSGLHCFDDFRNVYSKDGTLVHECPIIFELNETPILHFYIDRVLFWFDQDGLLSRDVDGKTYRVQTSSDPSLLASP